MTRFRAAIFDFDETMIDLEPQHVAASIAVCDALGSDYQRLPETLRLASGRRIVDELSEMRDFFGWNETVDELLAIRQKRFDELSSSVDIDLLPGVRESIDVIRKNGMKLAIATSAVGSSVRAVLRRLGLAGDFDVIVDGSMVRRAKPDPEAYLLTAEKLGVTPPHCVVFEDSQVGVAAAKAAGMYCVAVRNPNAHFRQDLTAADVEVTPPAECSGR